MAIESLRIADFRNLSTVLLAPHLNGLNIIYGNNGSGKTSLLEAIHCIGLGKSFRNGTSNQLIRHQTDKFVIFAHLVNETERNIPVGIERDLKGSSRLRVAEKDVTSMVELANFLPIRVINAHSHNLFEAGPIFRRKFLDWGLFYQFPSFLSCWRNFERVLKQRNVLLRDKRSKRELECWTEELVKYGLELSQFRQQYVSLFLPHLGSAVQELLTIPDLQINYRLGWDESQDYATVLADYYQEEYRAGHTQFGPHRADLDIDIEGISVRHFLSRGQQKLLVCAMIVAQGMMLASQGKKVIYLIDDLPAELDISGRGKLMTLLAKQQAQIFITAIDKETICAFMDKQPEVPMKVFHVEHGCVVEVSS